MGNLLRKDAGGDNPVHATEHYGCIKLAVRGCVRQFLDGHSHLESHGTDISCRLAAQDRSITIVPAYLHVFTEKGKAKTFSPIGTGHSDSIFHDTFNRCHHIPDNCMHYGTTPTTKFLRLMVRFYA